MGDSACHQLQNNEQKDKLLLSRGSGREKEFYISTNVNPNSSGICSNLHNLCVPAFFTYRYTEFPFQLITQISKFTVFDVYSIIFYSICVPETKNFSLHFLEKQGRLCGKEPSPSGGGRGRCCLAEAGGRGKQGMCLFLGSVNL